MPDQVVVPLPVRPDSDEESPEGRSAIVLEFPLPRGPEGGPPKSDGGAPPNLAV